ncbi:alpha/beta hydrolase [Aquabacter sp. CN5-332]|uniref:alpha/beta fold hydrolase n=1 Tax=Aquabacter sp. CN5-332 TaxID=3156608 RepID=UPI0032B5441F
MLDTPPPRSHHATTPDGLSIAVREWGDPAGRPVLFIHGYAQSGLCWERQVADPALTHLRLVTYDLRGHGASSKPLDPPFYQEGRRWADEVAAIITQCALERPVLAGWSYGGRIIGDYLTAFGASGLSGLVFVDAVTDSARHFYGSCNHLMRMMADADPATNIAGTRAFLKACFHNPPEPDLYETQLAASMMAPSEVRAAMVRPANYGSVLSAVDVPALVIHGVEDQVIAPAMAEHIAACIPGARLEMIAGAGHAPFLECPAEFNALLAAFTHAVT